MQKKIKEIMSIIIDNNYEVYLVGGYVRDYLLNIPNDDYDLTTNMPLEKLKLLFPNLHIMKENNHRNTATLKVDNMKIEITTFKGNNIEEDLLNRDFTINAFALNINNLLLDPYNYKEDLDKRILKLVKEDGSGIDYDPLRILRAIRFALSHQLTIDIHTKDMLLAKKDLLNNVAKERIYAELIKILCYKEAPKYIDEYKEIFFMIIPELKDTYKFEQHNKYHIYDVFYHTLKVIDEVEDNKYLKLAALFHDLGKPEKFFTDEEGVGHFYGHWDVSNRIFKQFCKKYKVDKTTENIVSLLIINHDRSFPIKRSSMINYLREFNPEHLELLFKIKKADILAQNPIFHQEMLNKLKEDEDRFSSLLAEQPVLNEKDLLVNGKDLIDLGYQGEEIGQIKKELLNEIKNNKLKNNKKSIKKYLMKRREKNERRK